MADRIVDVVVEIGGEALLAGRMWSHRRGAVESATFAYDNAYLARPGAYELDPALPLVAGQLQTPEGRAIFGAFRSPGSGVFLADEDAGVPQVLELPKLLHAAERLERDEASETELRELLRGGSSLGGARPKAHVLDSNGRIAIAKFPSPFDADWDVMRWEAVALDLARQAGITVSA